MRRTRNKNLLLSYEQALEQILAATETLPETDEVDLGESVGRALARDVFASVSLPPFDNTAIDGFAVRAEDTVTASSERPTRLTIVETIAAGSVPAQNIRSGQAARILTGAPLPRGADALVMVEDTRESAPDEVEILVPASGRFIRRAGSDLPAGALGVSNGSEIDIGTVALLAALGQSTAFCTRRPRVSVLTTGDEIHSNTRNGTLPFGSIFDANGPALAAAVRQAGGTVVSQPPPVPDDPSAIRMALGGAAGCDIIITSGGVSVGEYDFVKAAVEEVGSLDFWRIAIKPGKPLAFGRIGSALFFGLPGNPVSSLVTFELFVRPALRKLAGYSRLLRPVIPITLGASLPHQSGRREFARARLESANEKGGSHLRAYPLGAQDSHRLSSLASADVLLIAHEDHEDYSAGETLPAMLLH
jgi:molybdopterin molybdotransferase